MSDRTEHEQTISHLREVIFNLQKKLDLRSAMLATLAPYITNAVEAIEALPPYAVMEFFRRHEADFLKFKEDYGKEHYARQDGNTSKP